MTDHNRDWRTGRSSWPRRCDWCGESIAEGEVYARRFIVCEGDAWTMCAHLECARASDAYDSDGDSIPMEGQFERGHSHEPGAHLGRRWEGEAAGCPGCQDGLFMWVAGPEWQRPAFRCPKPWADLGRVADRHDRDWRLRRHDAPLPPWIHRHACIGMLAFSRFHGRACDMSSEADINQLSVCRMLARARVRARWEAEQ